MEALEDVNELEAELDQTKEAMYKLSYVIRVAASSYEELKRRCNEIKDFYDDWSIKLVRPLAICWAYIMNFFLQANDTSTTMCNM